MPRTHKATYTPQGDAPEVPVPGARGLAWAADGNGDPRSAEYGAWLFKPEGDENAYYVAEDDLTFDPELTVERAAYRKPTGIFSRSLAGAALILKVRIGDAVRAIKGDLLKAAAAITKQLGTDPTGGATYRTGMPEALYMVLDQCGDHEAARLACETFLERNPRPDDTAPACGEYRNYLIEAGRAGWIVFDGQNNVMPDDAEFESVANARAAIDLLYEHGLRVTDDFLAECRPLTVQTATVA